MADSEERIITPGGIERYSTKTFCLLLLLRFFVRAGFRVS